MSKWVSIARYLCPVYGGNDGAAGLSVAVRKIAKTHSDGSMVTGIDSMDYARVFTGQGKPEDISMIMHFIWYAKEEFAAYKDISGKTI